ncbi:hypothetical protein EG327_003133 [Venturia inaequalis]|uniref:Uncharacterized protein n=1 Tax=Venturia inaequalis TaxID=5025 RepID=A0A8H3VKE5_VENIN|nr:hypothetical protein EG327_003133 [Venturia inaequalis]
MRDVLDFLPLPASMVKSRTSTRDLRNSLPVPTHAPKRKATDDGISGPQRKVSKSEPGDLLKDMPLLNTNSDTYAFEGITTKKQWKNLMYKLRVSGAFPVAYDMKLLLSVYDAVRDADFNSHKQMDETVVMVIFCSGFDQFNTICGDHIQMRFCVFVIIMRKALLGLMLSNLEECFLKAWFEVYAIPHQFYWRLEYVRAWLADRTEYLPRLCGRKMKATFNCFQERLNLDLHQSIEGKGAQVSQTVAAYKLCFGQDFLKNYDSAHDLQTEIRRRYVVPWLPPATAQCPSPEKFVVSWDFYNQTCGDEAYKYHARSSDDLAQDIENAFNRLAIDAQAPVMITPEIAFCPDAMSSYYARPGTSHSLTPGERVLRIKPILRGSHERHGYTNVPEASKHELTLDTFRQLVQNMEECRKILAARLELANSTDLDNCIKAMKRVKRALKPDIAADMWHRIKYTSVGADMHECMRQVRKLVVDTNLVWCKTKHPIGRKALKFSKKMLELSKVKTLKASAQGW